MGTDRRVGGIEERLRDEADAFAARLARLLNGTVRRGTLVKAVVMEGRNRATVAPVPDDLQSVSDKRIGLVSLDGGLWLRVHYRVSLDDECDHLRVERSAFGLIVDRSTGLSPIRIEYDRYKTAKQQSHVQVLGESTALGYAFAKAGSPVKPLSKLHLPAGSRRFRPTLEDFIEFLSQEGMLPSKQAGWKAVIDESRREWEMRQTRAAVRRMPDAAVEQLAAMGYEVSDPTPASGHS